MACIHLKSDRTTWYLLYNETAKFPGNRSLMSYRLCVLRALLLTRKLLSAPRFQQLTDFLSWLTLAEIRPPLILAA